MSCPFCEIFTSYERQMARRLQTDTLAMSEENAQHVVEMATLIRAITGITLRRVKNEAVPTLICDLLGGFAEGLMEELNGKMVAPGHPGEVPRSRRLSSLPPDRRLRDLQTLHRRANGFQEPRRVTGVAGRGL
jgi:hypothetical protein